MTVIGKKHALSILVMASMSFTGVPVWAHDGMGGAMHSGKMQGPKKQQMMEAFYTRINATSAQRQQLETLHQQAETQMKPLRDNMWQKKKDLMTYMASPQATEAEAMRRQQEITDLETQMDRMRIQQMFRKKAVLTPEQQQKAAAFFQEQQAKWQKGMKNNAQNGIPHDMHEMNPAPETNQ